MRSTKFSKQGVKLKTEGLKAVYDPQNHTIVQYIRRWKETTHSGHYQLVGVMVCRKVEDKAIVAWSKCKQINLNKHWICDCTNVNEKDKCLKCGKDRKSIVGGDYDVFNKEKGLRIAKARIDSYKLHRDRNIPRSIAKNVDEFCIRCQKYFKAPVDIA